MSHAVKDERATGRTIRALLKTAHRLSKGRNLVLFSDGRLNEVRYFMGRLRELVGMMGFLDTDKLATHGRIQTVNGGIIEVYHSEQSSGLRGKRAYTVVEEI